MLTNLAPIVSASLTQDSTVSSATQDSEGGLTPWDTWDDDADYISCETNADGNEVCDYVLPWGGDEMMQFKEYYTFETIRARMMRIAADNPGFIEFHEGLNGGTNARGEETTADTYEGWHYGHLSPWLKITANVQGGEYNAFNGDRGNYADRPDVMIVGNHHAREWMSHTLSLIHI